jgi:hypothetical protein
MKILIVDDDPRIREARQRMGGGNAQLNRDGRRLALIAERLARVEVATPTAREHVQRIIQMASALLEAGVGSDGAATGDSRARAPAGTGR